MIRGMGNQTSYHSLYRNNGDGTFTDVSPESGIGARRGWALGLVACDYDNDGDIDAVILNSREKPKILRNESGSENHWIQIRLLGVRTNRDGVGARVKMVAGDLVQFDEVHSGRGYQSHFGTRLHFGLGEHNRIDQVEVRWIGGGVDSFTNLPVNQILTLSERSHENEGTNR